MKVKCRDLLSSFAAGNNVPSTSSYIVLQNWFHDLVLCSAGSRGIQPSFSPGSYLRLPGGGRRPEQTAIDLLVNPTSTNGILVFLSGGGTDHRVADFLALGLQDGRVRLALNLGKNSPSFDWILVLRAAS